MTTYNVEFTRTAYVDFDVEAEDEEQAEEKAWDLLEERWLCGDISGDLGDWEPYGICQSDYSGNCQSSYTLRVRGKLDKVASLFGHIYENETMGAAFGASLGLLSEDGDVVLAVIGGDCRGLFSDAVKRLYGGVDLSDIARTLGLEMEAFSTSQRDTGEHQEDYCEHLHANAQGELIAHELEEASDIIELSDDETVEEMLETYGYDPDDRDEIVELEDGVFTLGCSIEMYQWSKELSE